MLQTKPKIRTILFTEVCPLNCTYCMLKTAPNFGSVSGLKKEQLFEQVKKCDEDGIERILFTGGEPLAFWPWIKEIIEKYGKRFEYAFNTSGYNFTKEMLEFLSNYKIYFTLSVDGPKKISQWRRPNNGNFKYDYWEKFLENVTTLLYYFPNTAWKTVMSKKMIEYIPDIFDSAHELGFKSIDIVIDFKEQPWRNHIIDNGQSWTDKDWEKYNQAMQYVSLKAIDSFEHHEWPTLTREQIAYMYYFMNQTDIELKAPFQVSDVLCGVGGHRDIVTMYEKDNKATLCLKQHLPDKTSDEILDIVEKSFNEGCLHDKKCQFSRFCAASGCLSENYRYSKNWFTPHPDDCLKRKIECTQVMLLLNYCNENLWDNTAYAEYIAKYIVGMG